MTDEPLQLSLEVGGPVGAYLVSEFSLSGKVQSLSRELERNENVIVTIVGEDGEVLLRSDGWVKSVAIETVPRTANAPVHTKRKHSIKLGEAAPIIDE